MNQPQTISITGAGRYYAPNDGSITAQVIAAAGGLSFTIEVTNWNPGTSFSTNIDYGLNSVLQGMGVACAPAAGDLIDVVPGNSRYVVFNVAGGTGTLEVVTNSGLKLLS